MDEKTDSKHNYNQPNFKLYISVAMSCFFPLVFTSCTYFMELRIWQTEQSQGKQSPLVNWEQD